MSRKQGDNYMSASAIAQAWVEELERLETAKGATASQARVRISRRIGISASAMDYVARGRAKRITVELFERLQSAVIGALQNEIARATHELEMARRCGLDPRASDMDALKAQIAKAQTLIGEQA